MDMTREYSDGELRKLIDSCIEELEKKIPMIRINRNNILTDVFNGRRRMGIIQPLMDNPDVNEIMINGTDGIFAEEGGALYEYTERYKSKEELFNSIQTMLSWANRTVNESSPIVDARLSTGARINVVLNPVAINGPIVTIRKFAEKQYTLEDFVQNGTVTAQIAAYLNHAVEKRKSIIISGGTSSGKTTFLNVLSSLISENSRIITIEDSAELKLCQKNVVRLETRNPNTEGRGEIKMRALIKTALRMRPDRILIGEVRDESALDMLTAMCTGHTGCMSTVHANSAGDVLVRIETLSLWEGHVSSQAIRQMIVSGIDIIVYLERTADARAVREISEVRDLYENQIILDKIF